MWKNRSCNAAWIVVAGLGLAFAGSAQGQKAPNEIPGSQMWLRADTVELDDGNPLDIWFDDSGNDRAAMAFDEFVPTFRTDVINGLSVVFFDGTSGGVGQKEIPRTISFSRTKVADRLDTTN